MRKVDFFIVGAAKAGTTSLYQYLNKHPDIYFSPVKEPNYFATDINIDKFSETYKNNTFLDLERYFSQDTLSPLQLTYIRKAEHYERLFSGMNSEKLAGEASTSYLLSGEAAKNIYSHNPEAKIIAMLRNPVDRAFSHYLMALRYGHVTGSFRKVVEKDMNQPQKGIGISEMFIEFGKYATQLERYFRRFDQDQLKLILFEDLEKHTDQVVNEVLEFLGLEPLDMTYEELFNTGKIPRYPKLNKWLTESGVKNLFKNVVSQSHIERLKNLMMKSGKRQTLSKSDRAFLIEIYQDEIERLSMMIGRDLSHWQKLSS